MRDRKCLVLICYPATDKVKSKKKLNENESYNLNMTLKMVNVDIHVKPDVNLLQTIKTPLFTSEQATNCCKKKSQIC